MTYNLNEIYKSLKYHGIDMPFLIGSYGGIINLSDNVRDKIYIVQDKKTKRKFVNMVYNGNCYRTSLARCIALAFIPVPNDGNPDDYEADHINGINYEDRLDNIQWLTSDENRRKEINNDGFLFRGESNGMAKTTESQVRLILDDIVNGLSPKEISNKYNISKDIIIDIKLGRCWRHISKDYDIEKFVNRRVDVQRYDVDFKNKLKNAILKNPNMTAKEICRELNIEYTDKYRQLIYNTRKKCMSKVQRLVIDVHPSGWKWEAPHTYEDEDIV